MRGFTLIEILVVTTIIFLLVGVTAPIYQTSQRHFALQRSASKLAQDIRRVQEMAMSARDFPEVGGTISKGGYGVYFNIGSPEEYILFTDCNQNHAYDTGNWPAGSCVSSTGANIYPEKFGNNVKFEKQVKIDNLSPLGGDNSLHITFTPPDPTTWVRYDGNISTSTPAAITLRAGNTTANVKVLSTGLIFVE